MKRARRILIVDDDAALVEVVKAHLEDGGFEVHAFSSGTGAVERYFDSEYSLVILDWILPGLSGIEVCKQIRAADKNIPIIMLSCRGEEEARIEGLDAGCDDYITKPFGVKELAARIRAVLRRYDRAHQIARGKVGGRRIEIGDLLIDRDSRSVVVSGKPVHLTVKEYDLLCLLASNPGRTYSRRQLLDLLWDYGAEVYDHTVNSHINRLRAKIEKTPISPRYILTVWGVGYRFADARRLPQNDSQ